MPVHRVLVQAQQQIDVVAVRAHPLVATAERQEDVPASDDRLIRVVRVQMQAAPCQDASEDVAGCRDPLAGSPSDADGEVETTIAHGVLLGGRSPLPGRLT